MSNESNSDEPVDDLKTKTESSEDNSDTNASGFPLNIDHRFEYIKDLGKGGGGLVCLAYDHKLQRKVALKFLLSSDLIDIKTLFKEARAQAQLKHESICQIYEVLEAEGQIYLVMQYIQGKELEHLSDQFTLEQKLLIIKKILLGLHQSHTQGIIHRDIKPSNILVEVSDQGELKPYLIDFGIAHAHNQLRQDVLITGIGTPIYMAPEQADHESIHIDRRADIYSMGATLYHLLCGFPPVKVSDTTSTTSRKWTDFLGEPLISFAENVPQDLQTLIIKCLEIEPKKRYSSARELADEIEKYLNGEPISAHKGKAYRIKKKVKKNKVLVSITSAFLLALISTGGWFVYESHQQSIREELIQDFTSRVENLEARVRFTYMAPLHDISPAIEKWRQEIKDLENEIENLGEIAFGPGHYAIGRMHYAFQEYDDALEHLNLAWESGFRQPRVAYVLALTNGAIYQRQKIITLNITDKETRENKLLILDKQYRQPAIILLEHGIEASPYQVLAKATLLYYQEKYDQALNEIKNINEYPSWFYQYKVLVGDIYRAKADSFRATSENKKIQKYTNIAHDSYTQAINIAPSDFQLRLKPIQLHTLLLLTSLYYDSDVQFENELQKAEATIKLAQLLNSKNYQTYFMYGQLLTLKTEYNNQFSGGSSLSLNQAINQLTLATKIEPNKSEIWKELALSYSYKTSFSQENNNELNSEFSKAIDAFSKVKASERDANYFNRYGFMMKNQALNVSKKTRADSKEYFIKAVEAYEKSHSIFPKKVAPLINLGSVFRLWSESLPYTSAEHKLLLAIDAYKRAIKLNHSNFVTSYYLGMSYRRLAQIENGLSKENLLSLKESEKHLAKARELSQQHPFVQNEIAILKSDKAVYNWQKGQPYKDLVQQALKIIDISLKNNPTNQTLLSTKAAIHSNFMQINFFNGQWNDEDYMIANESIQHSLELSDYNRSDYYLLKLLLDEKISEKLINELSENNDRNLLLKAIWYSKNNKFKIADRYFSKIRQITPSLLLKYRLKHLLDWRSFVSNRPPKALQKEIVNLSNMMEKYYPNLVTY